MRVLVTGGLGFVGRAVARELLARGYRVDVLSSSDRVGALALPGIGVVRADLRHRAEIGQVVAAGGYDGVCHLAALTKVRDSFTDPVGYYDVNLTGTVNLVQALDVETIRTGRPTRLVFSSTAAVYGAREGMLDEDQATLPVSPYGASKLAAEQVIGYQAALGRLGAVSLRCFNIAGAVAGRGDRDLTRMIPKTLAVAAGLVERLEINGDGGAIREYTHVLDVAAAVGLALDAAGVGTHRVYNLGTGQGVSVAEVVGVARAVTGRPIPAVHCPPKPEARILIADPGRIGRELGWRPVNSSLEQILRDGWSAVPADR
jgi:UDP-glucose 4-epimerase